MAALVADYNSTSSGETESESSSENDETDNEYSDRASEDEEETEKLPLPDILNDGSPASGKYGHDGGEHNRSCSVFFNPFKAKEDAKLAILEKHVKLSEPRNENETERKKFRKKKKGQRRQVVETNNADDIDSFRRLGKRRIGVTDSIIPPKKSLKAYERQRHQERQRTSTKGRDT